MKTVLIVGPRLWCRRVEKTLRKRWQSLTILKVRQADFKEYDLVITFSEDFSQSNKHLNITNAWKLYLTPDEFLIDCLGEPFNPHVLLISDLSILRVVEKEDYDKHEKIYKAQGFTLITVNSYTRCLALLEESKRRLEDTIQKMIKDFN